MIRKMICVLLTLAAAGCIFFAAIPVVMYRFFNAGVAALLALAAVCGLQVWLLARAGKSRSAWEVFSNHGSAERMLRLVLGVLLCLFVVAELLLSAWMLQAATRTPVAGEAARTVVVAGAHVIGDQPSLMLQNRLELALDYLNKNPGAQVVVTGGQGKDEEYTEASIQAAWLEQRGIDPARILQEDTSTNTLQNLSNTAAIMVQAGLPSQVVICTDAYHQLRSQLYARLHGLQPVGLACGSPWGLLPGYWLREQAAILRALVTPGVVPMLLGR